MSPKLLGGKDDLDTLGIVSLGDWVIQNANCSDDLAGLLEFIITTVAWIADDDWCLGGLITLSDALNFAIASEENLVDTGLEHESASMNGAKSRESLW